MTKNKVNIVTIIQWLIVFLIPITINLVPVSEIFTQQIKIFFMITTAGILILAFEFFDYGLAAMFIPSMYAIAGIVPTATAFSGYANNIPWLVLGALLLTIVLDETGILKRIAYWCILKCGGTFNGIVWGIFVAGMILSVLTSGSANFLLAPFCFGVCKALNLGNSKESAIIMFSGCISTISTSALIYKPAFMALALGGAKTVDPNITVSWLGYSYHNLPNILFCFLLVLVSFVIFRPNSNNINGKAYFQQEYEKLGKVSTIEKKAFAITALLFTFILTTNIHGIAMEWGFVLIPWLFLLPGINCANSNSVRKVNFSMVLLDRKSVV